MKKPITYQMLTYRWNIGKLTGTKTCKLKIRLWGWTESISPRIGTFTSAVQIVGHNLEIAFSTSFLIYTFSSVAYDGLVNKITSRACASKFYRFYVLIYIMYRYIQDQSYLELVLLQQPSKAASVISIWLLFKIYYIGRFQTHFDGFSKNFKMC